MDFHQHVNIALIKKQKSTKWLIDELNVSKPFYYRILRDDKYKAQRAYIRELLADVWEE